jgi:hypothetical protein
MWLAQFARHNFSKPRRDFVDTLYIIHTVYYTHHILYTLYIIHTVYLLQIKIQVKIFLSVFLSLICILKHALFLKFNILYLCIGLEMSVICLCIYPL